MVKETAKLPSQLTDLKDRLHRAGAELTITLNATDDSLIRELLGYLGGHAGSSKDKRTLRVAGNATSAIIALGCGLTGIYEARVTPSLTRRAPASKKVP